MTSPSEKTSVLIVEDEGIIAENLRELLLSLDYDAVCTASTSDEAVECASKKCPDVVLMDIRIKGKIDGIATAKLLRERFDVPIIYLTAHADTATIERARVTEPHGYLVKPVRAPDLRSAIEIARYKHCMEKQLRARERWFSTTVRSIADAVIAVDLAGRITFMNPAAEALVAMTLGEAQGRSAHEVLRLLDMDSRIQTETPLDRALRERQSIEVPEAVLENGGSSQRIIADSAAPVVDNGELLGAVMVFRDVTEQKRLQKQLEIADRLASLGTMAAGVAHEINNPLCVVVANAGLVLEELAGLLSPLASATSRPEQQARALGEAMEMQRQILSAASRIARIVSDLGAFSRPEPQETGSVDVRDAVEWAIRSTAHEFRHRARLTTKLQKVPRVDADETRLGQVLVNLLINAAHSIAPGDVEGNEVSVSTRTDEGGHVIIEVSDSGSGIPPEILNRIFEPFFTTKPVGLGTGLGLSICHGIVVSMGGELTIESRVGEGTTFQLELPASIKQNSDISHLSEPVVIERRGRLLIIDDEEMVLGAVARILDGHELVCTPRASEALIRLEDDDRFDIILCDLMMPSMTGIEFYEQLLRARPDLAHRVVFLTGGAMTSTASEFLRVVPNQRVQKPFGVRDLRTMVQQTLAANERD
ncbi:MAG: response regulator [Pseudomonadota bacterium]